MYIAYFYNAKTATSYKYVVQMAEVCLGPFHSWWEFCSNPKPECRGQFFCETETSNFKAVLESSIVNTIEYKHTLAQTMCSGVTEGKH